jgi:MOSC domain-containing protein YiiM
MSAEPGTVAAVSRNDAYTFTKPNRDEIVLVAGLGVEGDIHAGVNVRHRSRVKADPAQPNLRQVHLIHTELFDEVAGKGFEVPAGGLGENVTTSGIDLLGLPRGTILRFGEPAVGDDSAGVGSGGGGGTAGGGAGGAGGASAIGGVAAAGDASAAGGESTAGGATVAGGAVDGFGGGSPVEAVLVAAAAATLDEATARATAAVSDAVRRDALARDRDAGDARAAIVVAGLRNPCAQINGFRTGLLKEMVGQDDEGNVVRKAGVMAVVLRGGPVRPGDRVTVELPPGPHAPLEKI